MNSTLTSHPIADTETKSVSNVTPNTIGLNAEQREAAGLPRIPSDKKKTSNDGSGDESHSNGGIGR